MFKSFPQNLDFEDLKNHKSLYIHVQKMKTTLDILLSKVNEERKFVQLMIELGKLHASVGAEEQYAKVTSITAHQIDKYTELKMFAKFNKKQEAIVSKQIKKKCKKL